MSLQNGDDILYMKALTEWVFSDALRIPEVFCNIIFYAFWLHIWFHSWLTVIARRMINLFLHPDIIYKQTQLYQIESDAIARTDALMEKVISILFLHTIHYFVSCCPKSFDWYDLIHRLIIEQENIS